MLEPLIGYLETHWRMPGSGIWETRASQRQYVDSKLMAWVGARGLETLGVGRRRDGDAARLTALQTSIRAEIERAGFDPERSTFTQSYGSEELDASNLVMPIFGFLPADDVRVTGTIAAIERDLTHKGFVYRYSTGSRGEGTKRFAGEGAFTMCGFWLVQSLARCGRVREAVGLFERLLSTANDVGLLSEEYDPDRGEPVGNVPQAFSHSGLIDAAVCLSECSAAQPSRYVWPGPLRGSVDVTVPRKGPAQRLR